MKKEKKGNISTIIIVILAVLVLVLGGFIVYDKVLKKNDDTKNTETKKDEKKETEKKDDKEDKEEIKEDDKKEEEKKEEKKEEIKYKSYKIGDKVTVKLNDSNEATFYVLKASGENEKDVTLFAEKNIGNSAFNNNYTDGNEYKGSLIEKRLNELTNTWTNVKEKRLITVDEILATGLTETQMEARCVDAECPEEEYTYVKKDSFLRYPRESVYEFYWTMTKVDKDNAATGNTNRYVYYVDMSGCIEMHIVGYKPGSNENKEGKFFTYYGIRPVIVISKEFVK